jgi:fucose permease
MSQKIQFTGTRNIVTIKWLTYLMFMMFAMTTDAVGEIIKEVMKQFSLSMTMAGLLHYGPMVAIAIGGLTLGFLADKLGRKETIILGLALFALNSYLFIAGNTFWFFLSLLLVSGLAIGIFKTGALALIGDISNSNSEHTATMNLVEGFFGVGAIIGTFLVSFFISEGIPWKYLYVVAGTLSVVLIIIAWIVKYPQSKKSNEEPINLSRTLKMLKDPYALGFSFGAFLYVAVESAIYVWMPTLLLKYTGNLIFVATYSLSIFFILRASGRFLGGYIFRKYEWSSALLFSCTAIFICFLITLIGGISVAVIFLPLSGLFMSVVYPTINSKGISCFPKTQHGAVAGVILFFTAAGAALGPLSMGAVSDAFGKNAMAGFLLATIFAGLLMAGALWNRIFRPTKSRLQKLDASEY